MKILKKIIFRVAILAILGTSIDLAWAVWAPFYTPEKYAGQWLWLPSKSSWNPWNNDIVWTNSTNGLKWNINNEFWVKTKFFTSRKKTI